MAEVDDSIDSLIDALSVECSLHFAEGEHDPHVLARSAEIWRAALRAPAAQTALTTVLVMALKAEKARRSL
ncbi:MAG TPA: hypothetical protein VIJ94_09285 [Caulobacteraceae bacterium]